MRPDGTMVFAFQCQHPVPSVCQFPCEHCCERAGYPGTMSGPDGVNIQVVPLYIRREVTRGDYLEFCKMYANVDRPTQNLESFYYEVSSD